jgi:hypothetical protein
VEPTKKKFWGTPEGKVTLVLLIGVGIALFYLWGSLVPFLIMALENTLYFIFLCIVVGLLLFLLLNKSIRNLVWNIYRISMRAIINQVVTIDPIGILKNRIESMEKDEIKLNDQRSILDGAIQKLFRKIEDFKKEIMHLLGFASKAQEKAAEAEKVMRMYEKSNDQVSYQNAALERSKWLSEAKTKAGKAGSLKELMEGKFIPLHQKMSSMSLMLGKAAQAVHYTIESTRNEVEVKEIEYTTVKTSYSALSSAISAIKGNPDERAIYEQSLAYIEEDLSRKLGAMRQMMETTSQVVANMDIENEISVDKGIVLLDKFMAGEDLSTLLDPAASKTTPYITVQALPTLPQSQQPKARVRSKWDD